MRNDYKQIIKSSIDKLMKVADEVYSDAIKKTIHDVYAAQPPVTDNNGEVLTKMDPIEVPKHIVRDKNGFSISNESSEEAAKCMHDIGMHEIYGKHPKTIISNIINQIEWQKSVAEDIKRRL